MFLFFYDFFLALFCVCLSILLSFFLLFYSFFFVTVLQFVSLFFSLVLSFYFPLFLGVLVCPLIVYNMFNVSHSLT